jgi:hypothetical protein
VTSSTLDETFSKCSNRVSYESESSAVENCGVAVADVLAGVAVEGGVGVAVGLALD